MTTYKFGIDIGNSTSKCSLLTEKNKKLSEGIHPSAVTDIADEKYLTFYDDDTMYFRVVESSLNHVDGIVAVGKEALALPNYREFDVTSSSYKANHELTTSILFGVLMKELIISKGSIPKKIDVLLAVSVPIVEAKTIDLVRQYQQLLQNTHHIEVYTATGKHLVEINFARAQVLNEGQAGFLGLMDTSDKEFQAHMDAIYKALGETLNPISSLEDFLIVDIGEGTTDLAVFRDKRFNPDYSYSVTKGYGNLLEEAISNANREGLTAESRKDIQSILTSTNARRKKRRELWESYVHPTRKAYIDSLLDTILKTYGNRDYFDAIIFLGGGYTALTNFTIESDLSVELDLFTQLKDILEHNKKDADLIFGVPGPYARTINERGLMQVLTAMN